MAASPEKHKHGNEMVGLLLLALGLLLFLSLVSYSATDPCFSVSGDGGAVKNYIGIIGAFLSDALLQIVGLSAFSSPSTSLPMPHFWSSAVKHGIPI
jgi:S-DNA-T family DNA segregation ATPase FtsK/SpoIIIE